MPADMVNHPGHYGGDTLYETIKVIEAWGLGFNLGNAVKYVSRAGRKGNALEDLRKAQFYLNREIARLEMEVARSQIRRRPWIVRKGLKLRWRVLHR